MCAVAWVLLVHIAGLLGPPALNILPFFEETDHCSEFYLPYDTQSSKTETSGRQQLQVYEIN